MGGTKLERFLPKNQHTQRKLLNFENWVNGESFWKKSDLKITCSLTSENTSHLHGYILGPHAY